MVSRRHLVPFLCVLTLLYLGSTAHILTPPTNITTGFVHFPNATTQVSWFYTQSGLVAYDGDVIFGTQEEFNRALVNITFTNQPNNTNHQLNDTQIISRNLRRRSYPPSTESVHRRANSIWPSSSGIWPGGNIYYRYWDAATENELSVYVNGAIDAWKDAVPCLNFQKLANDADPSGSNGVVTIQSHNPNAGYCLASQVGYNGANSLWMVLDTGGACGIPEVIHEWGHLLGLIHEQKRPDAKIHDPFVCSNVIGYPWTYSDAEADAKCCGAGPTFGCCGWACQFTAQEGDYNIQDMTGPNSDDFDLDSIMLYRNDAFAKPNTFTLTKGPNDHNNPQKLSCGDINRIRELYGCLTAPTPAQCTTPSQCPIGCNPNSGANTCSWPTAQDCVYPSPLLPNPRAACACRAGFKATVPGITDGDTTKQWRLPADEGNFRVWVAQGVACDTLCDVSYGSAPCQEVTELPADCLHN